MKQIQKRKTNKEKMMETREELLKGLYYTKNMISKILAAQKEQVGIVAQYREEEQGIATTGVKNQTKIWVAVGAVAIILFHLVHGLLTKEFYSLIWFLVTGGLAFRGWKKGKKLWKFWAFLAVSDGVIMPFVYYWRYLGFWLTIIPAGAAAFFGVRYAIRKKNEQVEINNAAINMHNSEVQSRYDEVTKRLQKLKDEMFSRTSSWYPKSYYSLNAVNFFISAIENFRADSVKEMVNLFEATKEYKDAIKVQQDINSSLKQQTLNQEKINKQLQYANVLNITNLFLQAGTAAAVDANTQAVMDNTDAVKNIYNRMY